VRCPTSVKKVYVQVRCVSNGFVFICGANAFTALTIAPAGSAVLSAGSLVAKTTDTWAVVRVRPQHPNTACSNKQTQWNAISFQLEIFHNDSNTFHLYCSHRAFSSVHTFLNQQNAHLLLHHTTSFYNKINPTCFGPTMEPSSGIYSLILHIFIT
jgi:hypothetical protein